MAGDVDGYPFLYVGEGECGYFEWAEMFILFEKEPTAEQRKQITDEVPVPYADDPSWEGPILHVGSGQFVNMEIASNYDPDEGDEPEENDFLGAIASGSQVDRFHEHIEQWLRGAAEIVPIVCVVKPDDAEAGGTEYGKWHEWSLTVLPTTIFTRYENALPDEDSLAAYVLNRSIGFWLESNDQAALPESLRAWIDQ